MDNFFKILKIYPPASKASREVVNLTERKNPHTPVYGVKEFVCLSVVPIISGLAKQNRLKTYWQGLARLANLLY